MSPPSWRQRRSRLIALLFPSSSLTHTGAGGKNSLSDDELAAKLNEVLEEEHDEEIDGIAFGNKDIIKLGRLAKGTYGAVDMVRCRWDNRIYARKILSKIFVHRAKEQCFPLTERVIHSIASTSRTPWAPHLIAAYQTPLDLYMVTEYVEGGTLADLLEYAQGGIAEAEVRWWLPQAVAAIGWLHEQGFAHRDIKPANFLITPTSHLQLTDFGSAAQLLPASTEGVQLVPRDVCTQLCGTVDYISPEMLEFDEGKNEADEVDESFEGEGYARETDWWSLGVMVYEMVYGVVPFFADSMEDTLKRITNHRRTLQLYDEIEISIGLKDLIKGLLVQAGSRLGRRGLHEVRGHSYFKDVTWRNLHKLQRPTSLLLPQFTDSSTAHIPSPDQELNDPVSYFPEGSFTTIHPEFTLRPRPDQSNAKLVSPFYGFTWGPPKNAFDKVLHPSAVSDVPPTPRVLRRLSASTTSIRGKATDASYMTPLRTGFTPGTGTVRRTRPMSERQALQQLMSAVKESAHKRVLESGKKPGSQLARRDRTIVPMGISTGVTVEDEADLTGRTDTPPSPSPRPGSSLSRTRPPSRLTPTEEWPSLVHEREPPDKWQDMTSRRRKLLEGLEDAERRLRDLKLLVR
ncbi:kinase-like protein [Calocera viscosa TUFC12733]|uniref:non-specific serine/threonine protein kinase n=1 Tax=Calocera viscosa (strain TUFC12733) TaxID=1330018 RepID=A0A167IA93_CALVF|nr:kinase-like protein [Calocera viscosa TUFC12733]